MDEATEFQGRAGQVLRVLPHGTVMIWDASAERAYPFYRAGPSEFQAMELVRFTTDKTDTIAVTVIKVSGSRNRRHQRAGVSQSISTQTARA